MLSHTKLLVLYVLTTKYTQQNVVLVFLYLYDFPVHIHRILKDLARIKGEQKLESERHVIKNI